MSVPASTTKPRKAIPKVTAFIDSDACWGCRACVDIGPVACTDTVPGQHGGFADFRKIELDRGFGRLRFTRISRWGAAEMVDTPSAPARVADKGGLTWHIAEHGEGLVERARRNADDFVAKRRK